MLNNATREVNYRLSKWIIRNMEREQLLSPDEVKSVWEELLSYYSPPNKSIETVGGSVRAGTDDERHITIPLRRKTICGVCGNYYTPQVWHGKDRVLKCWGNRWPGHFCPTDIHIYEYAFCYLVKRIMLILISKRPEVTKKCKEFVRVTVTEESHKRQALRYLSRLLEISPDLLEIGDEPSIIIEQITVPPDRQIKATIVDATEIMYMMAHYTPKRGWQEEKPKPAVKRTVMRKAPTKGFFLSDEEKQAIDAIKARRTR